MTLGFLRAKMSSESSKREAVGRLWLGLCLLLLVGGYASLARGSEDDHLLSSNSDTLAAGFAGAADAGFVRLCGDCRGRSGNCGRSGGGAEWLGAGKWEGAGAGRVEAAVGAGAGAMLARGGDWCWPPPWGRRRQERRPPRRVRVNGRRGGGGDGDHIRPSSPPPPPPAPTSPPPSPPPSAPLAPSSPSHLTSSNCREALAA